MGYHAVRTKRGFPIRMALAGCVALMAAGASPAQNTPLPIDPFADLTDFFRLTYPLTGRTGQTSSYDRSGQNADAIFWYYLRANPRRAVMADLRGPGCVSRIWVTGHNPDTAKIEIFIDGAASPAVSAYMKDFFGSGTFPPFVPPLSTHSTGSWVSYIPIPYRRSCRIEAIDARSDNLVIYYNVTYRDYLPGEPLGEIFQRPPTAAQQAHLNLFNQQWANRGQDPKPQQPGQLTLNGGGAVNAGGKLTLANLSGAGVITGIRMTVSPQYQNILLDARVRARFDGSASNAVDAPLGAFSGSVYPPTTGAALSFGNSNNQLYSYWAMPYSNGAVLELVNLSGSNISNATFTVTYVPKPVSEVGRLRFHTQTRAQTVSGGQPSYTILNETGRGHYVGVAMSIHPSQLNWGILEGDEQIYVNGEPTASILGTGTEDYFNGGYYFLTGPVALPFSGLTMMDSNLLLLSVYRLHIPDPVVFRNGIIVNMEHGGVNEVGGDYRSTAFYYRDDAAGQPPADPVHPPLSAGALVNGDFEQGFSGHNNGEANGWFAFQSRDYYGQTGCTFSAATDQKYTGNTSQKIIVAGYSSGSPRSAGITQQVPVARGSNYKTTARLRIGLSADLFQGDLVTRLGVSPQGSTYFADSAVQWADAPATPNTWHEVSLIVTAETDVLSIFTIGQRPTAKGWGTATVWVDSVTLEPYGGPPPPPLPPPMVNAGFEQEINSFTWPMWRGADGNDSALERTYAASDNPDGVWHLMVKGLGASGKGAYQFVPNNWRENYRYRVSAWVRNLGTASIRYAIGYRFGTTGAAGGPGATFGQEVVGSTAWQQVKVEFTYNGGGTEGVTIYLKAINAGSPESAGFDKVQIEPLAPIGPPAISRSPATLSPSGMVGSPITSQTFTVQNTGGGTLNYTISDDAGWLSVSPSSGNSVGEVDTLTVSYNTAGLGAGQHQATIAITDAGASNSPQTIGVTLTLAVPPIPGDADGDGDVDQEDFGRFQACMTGPGIVQTEPSCQFAILDHENDVDQDDLNRFLGCMSGPNVAGNPNCRQ